MFSEALWKKMYFHSKTLPVIIDKLLLTLKHAKGLCELLHGGEHFLPQLLRTVDDISAAGLAENKAELVSLETKMSNFKLAEDIQEINVEIWSSLDSTSHQIWHNLMKTYPTMFADFVYNDIRMEIGDLKDAIDFKFIDICQRHL